MGSCDLPNTRLPQSVPCLFLKTARSFSKHVVYAFRMQGQQEACFREQKMGGSLFGAQKVLHRDVRDSEKFIDSFTFTQHARL